MGDTKKKRNAKHGRLRWTRIEWAIIGRNASMVGARAIFAQVAPDRSKSSIAQAHFRCHKKGDDYIPKFMYAVDEEMKVLEERRARYHAEQLVLALAEEKPEPRGVVQELQERHDSGLDPMPEPMYTDTREHRAQQERELERQLEAAKNEETYLSRPEASMDVSGHTIHIRVFTNGQEEVYALAAQVLKLINVTKAEKGLIV